MIVGTTIGGGWGVGGVNISNLRVGHLLQLHVTKLENMNETNGKPMVTLCIAHIYLKSILLTLNWKVTNVLSRLNYKKKIHHANDRKRSKLMSDFFF